jgi:cytosine/adenosine deaminase-related metal-dependent hydrolase
VKSAIVEVDALAGGPDGEIRPVGPHAWAVHVLDGVIVDIVAISPSPSRLRVLTPTLVNAHDHGRGHGTQQLGVRDAPLDEWIEAFLAATPADVQYEQVSVALAQMRDGGIGAVAVCINPTTPDFEQEIRLAASAARAVGIRAAIAVPIFTVERGTYRADRARSSAARREAETALDGIDALAAELADEAISIAYHPVGPQWVSEDVLLACAERSAATGRVVHMHLLETARQRAWADDLYPDGLLAVLDDMGLLTPRAVLAHGVHLRPAELELLAARGSTVVANVSSNFRLSSGIVGLAELARAGTTTAVGLDGMSLDDDLDMWRELRLVRGLWQAQRQAVVSAQDVVYAATAAGLAGMGSAAPAPVAVGQVADFVVHDLSPWAGVAALPHWPALEVVLARAGRATVGEVWSNGARVHARPLA